MNINDIKAMEADWRVILEGMGYNDLNFSLKLEPIQDMVTVNLYFYDSVWSSTHLPGHIVRTCSFERLADMLNEIDLWVRTVPNEADAREQNLLKDYAAIKERIDASRLPDILKAEAKTLMDMLTTNIITDQST